MTCAVKMQRTVMIQDERLLAGIWSDREQALPCHGHDGKLVHTVTTVVAMFRHEPREMALSRLQGHRTKRGMRLTMMSHFGVHRFALCIS